jgi:hypothetical protein
MSGTQCCGDFWDETAMLSWSSVGYALACVIVPVAWGLIVVWVSNHLDQWFLHHDRRKGRTDKLRPPHPIEYHI